MVLRLDECTCVRKYSSLVAERKPRDMGRMGKTIREIIFSCRFTTKEQVLRGISASKIVFML